MENVSPTVPFSEQVLKEIVDGIKVEADALQQAPASVIAGLRDCWNLKDDTGFGYATKNMNDEELQMAIIEDLLLVIDWRRQGKEVGGDFDHLTRFLDAESRNRVAAQINSPMVKSLITVDVAGKIEITAGHLQDAMDFCGFWIEGGEFLTEGNIISIAPAYR
jgi:hypothetical protein